MVNRVVNRVATQWESAAITSGEPLGVGTPSSQLNSKATWSACTSSDTCALETAARRRGGGDEQAGNTRVESPRGSHWAVTGQSGDQQTVRRRPYCCGRLEGARGVPHVFEALEGGRLVACVHLAQHDAWSALVGLWNREVPNVDGSLHGAQSKAFDGIR